MKEAALAWGKNLAIKIYNRFESKSLTSTERSATIPEFVPDSLKKIWLRKASEARSIVPTPLQTRLKSVENLPEYVALMTGVTTELIRADQPQTEQQNRVLDEILLNSVEQQWHRTEKGKMADYLGLKKYCRFAAFISWHLVDSCARGAQDDPSVRYQTLEILGKMIRCRKESSINLSGDRIS